MDRFECTCVHVCSLSDIAGTHRRHPFEGAITLCRACLPCITPFCSDRVSDRVTFQLRFLAPDVFTLGPESSGVAGVLNFNRVIRLPSPAGNRGRIVAVCITVAGQSRKTIYAWNLPRNRTPSVAFRACLVYVRAHPPPPPRLGGVRR